MPRGTKHGPCNIDGGSGCLETLPQCKETKSKDEERRVVSRKWTEWNRRLGRLHGSWGIWFNLSR